MKLSNILRIIILIFTFSHLVFGYTPPRIEITPQDSGITCNETPNIGTLLINGQNCIGEVRQESKIDLSVGTKPHGQKYALRIFTRSMNCSNELPLLVVIRRPVEVVSWKLPIVVPLDLNHKSHSRDDKHQSITYHKMSRTLCPLDEYFNPIYLEQNGPAPKENLSITFTTHSTQPISVEFSVYMQDFELSFNETRKNITISPTEPIFFRLRVPDNIPRALLEAKSTDHSCMTLSIQDSKCPVHDLYSNVKFDGQYQSMNRSGVMWISKRQYHGTVHVVLVAHPHDSECHLNPFRTAGIDLKTLKQIAHREKVIELEISKSETVNAFAEIMIGTVLCFIVFSLVSILIASTQGGYDLLKTKFYKSKKNMESSGHNTSVQIQEPSSISENYLSNYSTLYIKGLWIVALFYSIPVVQLVLTYEHMTNESGNKDQCYFNFKCAHALFLRGFPISMISDFNHVFSNIGYIILGILSIICIRIHQLRAKLSLRNTTTEIENDPDQNVATRTNQPGGNETNETFVLKEYGLYYSLGSALIWQGIMSSCYHICPNNVNFQVCIT